MFLVSATVFYLLNLTLSLIYGREFADWPLPRRIVLVSVPVTAIATWLVMPRAARRLQAWLYAPPSSRADQQQLRGSTG